MSLLKKTAPGAAGAAPKPTLKKAAPAPVEEENTELVEDTADEDQINEGAEDQMAEDQVEDGGDEAEAVEEAPAAPRPALKKPAPAAAPAAKPALKKPAAAAPKAAAKPALKPAAPAAKAPVKPAAKAPVKPAAKAPVKPAAKPAAAAAKKAPSLKIGSAKTVTKAPTREFEIYTDEAMSTDNTIVVQISENLIPEAGSRFNRDGLIALVAERLKYEGFSDINLETASKIVKGVEDVLRSITSNFDLRFMDTMFKLTNVKERVYPPRPGSEAYINGYFMPAHTRSKSDRNISGATAYPFVYGEDGSINAVDQGELKAALEADGISVAPATRKS